MAKNQNYDQPTEQEFDQPMEAASDPKRMVNIKLHREKNKGKGIYVNVNNHNYFIPRGEVVSVPYYIAAVLENSALQDEQTARMIETLSAGADY